MTEKEDWVCLNKLLESSAQVLDPYFLTHIESRERITELYREILKDYGKFKNGECGSFKARVDQEMHTQFQMALLVVSYCAKKNQQALEPLTIFFSDKELEVCDLLKKFYLLESLSPLELRQKLILKDKTVEFFFTGYTGLRQSINQLLSHEEIRPAVRQYLKKQAGTYHDKFELAFGSEGGQFIVTSSLAQHSEIDFINRIEHKLKSHKNGIIFLDRTFTIDKISKGEDLLKPSQKSAPVNGKRFGIKENLPKNQYITAVLTEKSLLWGKISLIFYATFASHTEHYSENGFDSKPLETTEITAYLDSAVATSDKNYNHILFCIASPTGFETIDQSASDKNLLNRFISSNISVCLLDLFHNKKIFNKFDKKSIELSNLCDLETKGEKHLKLKEILYAEMERELLIHQSVSLKQCIDFSITHEFLDPEPIKKLFYQYAREKRLPVRDLHETGPVIVIKM
jgi:hypothetical protein